jgi:hypothetical protein
MIHLFTACPRPKDIKIKEQPQDEYKKNVPVPQWSDIVTTWILKEYVALPRRFSPLALTKLLKVYISGHEDHWSSGQREFLPPGWPTHTDGERDGPRPLVTVRNWVTIRTAT